MVAERSVQTASPFASLLIVMLSNQADQWLSRASTLGGGAALTGGGGAALITRFLFAPNDPATVGATSVSVALFSYVPVFVEAKQALQKLE